jgi:uncharacterized DUF497 family protein
MNAPTDFAWDDAKAASNLAEHGVPMQAGADVFLDPNRLDAMDARKNYGEERRNAIGLVGGVVLHVTYTMRDGDTARLISVRLASRKERKRYGP